MTQSAPRRAAIYARVSTLDQEPENQLAELRRYIEVRGCRLRNTSMKASVVRRISALRSTDCCETQNTDVSTCLSAGGLTVWGATLNI